MFTSLSSSGHQLIAALQRPRSAKQEAHQKRKSALNVDLHQIIGCKHIALAFIKYPWTHSAGQPASGMFDGIIT